LPTRSGAGSNAGSSGGDGHRADGGPDEARSVLEQQKTWSAHPPGCAGLRADEFIEAGERAPIVGVYWIAEDRSRKEPFSFQLVTVKDGEIAHIQNYRRNEQAIKAARQQTGGATS
jgi:hypothetical protein